MCKVLDKCRDAFSFDGRPGKVAGLEFEINTTSDNLPSKPPRRTSPAKQKIISDTVKQLLEWGVIEPSESKASHRVVLI